MNQIEIKELIDRNNAIMESLITPNKFTLNNTVAELLQENARLQKMCKHEYENGYCIYCYMSDPKNTEE